jgi:hypothetical protein
MSKLDEGQIADIAAGIKKEYGKYRKVRDENPQLSRLSALGKSLKGKEEKDPLKAAAATSQALGDIIAKSTTAANPRVTSLSGYHGGAHDQLVKLIRGSSSANGATVLKPSSEPALKAVDTAFSKLKTHSGFATLDQSSRKTADQYITAVQSRLQNYASKRFSQDLVNPQGSQQQKPIKPMSTSTLGKATKAAGSATMQGARAAGNWIRSRLPEEYQMDESLSPSQKLRLSGASTKVRRAIALAQMGRPIPLPLQPEYLKYLHSTGDVDVMPSGVAMKVIRQQSHSDIDYEKHIQIARVDPTTTNQEKAATITALRILRKQRGDITKLPTKSRTLITAHMQRTGSIAALPLPRAKQILKSQQ